MIIKGKARGNGKQLGRYLVSPGENERIHVVEVRGTVSADVRGAIAEMDAVGLCTRTDKTLYHAAISTRPEERLTEEQRLRAVDRLEEELGFAGQPRVIVVHEKKGREHTHVVWSRTDIEHGRAIRIDHNYRKHEIVSRALEREFGQERVQGAHIERDGRPRPARTLSQAELEQAKRTGIEPRQVSQEVTAIYRRTDSGRAFAAGLEESGYRLARGSRRDYVLIDAAGGIHSVSRRVEGVRAKDVRERLSDLEHTDIPSIAQAQRQQRENRAQRSERDLSKVAGEIRIAYQTTRSGADFASALEDRGLSLAVVSKDEAAAQHRKAAFARQVGNFAPAYKAGELVVLDQRGNVYGLTSRTTGATSADVSKRLAGIDTQAYQGVEQTREALKEASKAAFVDRKFAERPETKTEALLSRLVFSAQKPADLAASLDRNGVTIARTTEQDIERIKNQKEFDALYGRENNTPIPAPGETVAVDRSGNLHRLNPAHVNTAALENAAILEGKALPSAMEARDEKNAAREEKRAEKHVREEKAQASWDINKERHYAHDHDEKKTGGGISVAGFVGGLADFAVGFLASLGGSPKPTPAQRIAQQRQSIAALRSIKKDIDNNQPVGQSDLTHLTREHLENIRSRGDDYLRQLVDNLDRGRDRDKERERER
jgi:hypothetical protein